MMARAGGGRWDATQSGGNNAFTFKRPFESFVKSDEYYTPAYALAPLLPYLPKRKVIWECAWGQGHLARHLEAAVFQVVGRADMDFLAGEPSGWDVIVTNPPFSIKDLFLERAYKLGKPFAMLMPLETLAGERRNRLYHEFGLELLVPSRRIDFILNGVQTESATFPTAWFCWQLLPSKLIFTDLKKDNV